MEEESLGRGFPEKKNIINHFNVFTHKITKCDNLKITVINAKENACNSNYHLMGRY